MPERIYAPYTTQELIDAWKSLLGATLNGSTTALRNNSTGFLAETGNLTQGEILARIADIRWELYVRGRDDADTVAATAVPNDPRREKVMAVEVNRTLSNHPRWPYSIPC